MGASGPVRESIFLASEIETDISNYRPPQQVPEDMLLNSFIQNVIALNDGGVNILPFHRTPKLPFICVKASVKPW